MSLIYLDFNRTTPIAPSVLEAMQPYWLTHFMLPDQHHSQAQAIGEAMENAREGVARMAGCEPFEIVFTSGGTEANNLGVLGALANQDPGHILVSELEHQSVLEPVRQLAKRGWEIETIKCDQDGLVDADEIESRLRSDTQLVCVLLACPVLGTIQPIAEICDLCDKRGVPVHCDATQAFGKEPVDVLRLGAASVAISGHKFYGPKGSGAIYVRRGYTIAPISFGEPREMGLRPGAENVPACIGLGAAAALAAKCVDEVSPALTDLRDRFANGIVSSVGAGACIVAEDAIRLPNTICMTLPCDAKSVQRSARQLAMSVAQSHLPPDEITRALAAIGRPSEDYDRTIRLSLGWTTSHEQVQRAVELISDAVDRAISTGSR